MTVEAKKRQQTALFVKYNVTKTLSYVWDVLQKHNTSNYSYTHTSCWGDENPVNQGSIFDGNECLFRVLLSNHPAPQSEKEMMDHFLTVCEQSTRELSSYGSPYSGGFNSILECMRYEQTHFLQSILTTYDHKEYLRQYASEIDLPPNPGCEVNWMWYLSAFEDVKLAQAGQDSVLEVIFNMIGTTRSPYYVEIGYNEPFLTTGSNTLHMLQQGWSGLLIDGDHENHSINLHRHFVTPDNIVDIFDQHGVPEEPDYVSIDIDSLDVWVARSLLNSKYRPRVVSVEYNCNFPIATTLAMSPVTNESSPLDNSWNRFDLFYGATAGSIKLMAEEAGYDVVHFVGIHDMILVRRDLLDGDCPPPYARFSRRVGLLHSCIIDERRRGKWVEYNAYLRTNGDVAYSRLAALHQVLPMTSVDNGPRSSPECLGLVL